MAESEQPRGLVIAPMGIGEVLDTGFNLARRNYRWLVVVTAWGAVPSYVVLAVGGAGVATGLTNTENPSALAAAGGGFVVAMLLYALGTVVTSAALIIACARLIFPTDDPQERSVGYLYGVAVSRLLKTLGLGIILALTAMPLVIVFPLGVYVWVRWSVAGVAIFIEGDGPIAALKRSWAITRGSWWHTAVVIVASSLIVGILSTMAGGVFGVAGTLLGFLAHNETLQSLLNAVGQGIGFVLVEAFTSAILAVLYYELRARTEGFDLEQRALHLALHT